MRNGFRFFTPLRSVQNDKGRGVAFGMTKDGRRGAQNGRIDLLYFCHFE